jgi:hypothetical protein
LIILLILGKNYKSCSSSLCSFPHPPFAPFLFGSNILTVKFILNKIYSVSMK